VFILIWLVPLKHLGYKAVTTNISDICAIESTTYCFHCRFNRSFSFRSFDELFAGITHASNEYKVDVIGGDTTSSQRINHQHITII
jgi:thiamine-monophosphate kinase